MIRRFRYALTIVRDLSMILCPASDYVTARVDEARADVLAEREEHVEVWEGDRFGPVVNASCPGESNEPEHVAELVRYHHVTANQMDGVYCHCGHVSHNDRRHAHHVAALVEDMIAADVRLANRFHNS